MYAILYGNGPYDTSIYNFEGSLDELLEFVGKLKFLYSEVIWEPLNTVCDVWD